VGAIEGSTQPFHAGLAGVAGRFLGQHTGARAFWGREQTSSHPPPRQARSASVPDLQRGPFSPDLLKMAKNCCVRSFSGGGRRNGLPTESFRSQLGAAPSASLNRDKA